MRGQSYHLTNSGISFWFYLPLPFPYNPDKKKLFGVAFRGESTERKNNSSRSACAARTMYLHCCADFKVCVWSPRAAEHRCCAAPQCAPQHRYMGSRADMAPQAQVHSTSTDHQCRAPAEHPRLSLPGKHPDGSCLPKGKAGGCRDLWSRLLGVTEQRVFALLWPHQINYSISSC